MRRPWSWGQPIVIIARFHLKKIKKINNLRKKLLIFRHTELNFILFSVIKRWNCLINLKEFYAYCQDTDCFWHFLFSPEQLVCLICLLGVCSFWDRVSWYPGWPCLSMYLRITLNLWFSCLHLLSTGIASATMIGLCGFRECWAQDFLLLGKYGQLSPTSSLDCPISIHQEEYLSQESQHSRNGGKRAK